MSNIYSTEPKTSGAVTLNTTYGPLSIELWGKECPMACRNFIQLCLEGYYDGSPFHRLVPGFCLQVGKPACGLEDETDGSAIFPGGRFPIETHSRLKFNRRGLVGMVALNTNDHKNANGSQFFFTLSETPELNGQATLFGRLVNETIFNLLRMAELDIDPKTESPLYPPKIINTEVILNPFNDIIPRERRITSLNVQTSTDQQPSSESLSKLTKKNVSLLSFADEEDSVTDNQKKSGQLPSKSKATLSPTTQVASTSSAPHPSSSLQFLQQMKAVQMRDTQDKIKQMEEELGFKSAATKPSSSEAEKKEVDNKTMSALEKYKAKFEEKKKRKATLEGNGEMETLLLLNSFRQKLQKADHSGEEAQISDESSNPTKKHLDICKLHGLLNCLSCRDTFNINLNAAESENLVEKDWMMHKLVFDRRELEGQVREDLKDLVVIDPREQQAKISDKNNHKKDKTI